MPDGDVVHDTLKPRWLMVYEQVCEWDDGPEEVAHRALRTLKSGLKQYGDEPLQLIKEAAVEFDQIPREPLFRQTISGQAQSQKIEEKGRKLGGNLRGMGLAKAACKKVLLSILNGEAPPNVAEEIMKQYTHNVYTADFSDRVPLTKQHHNDVPLSTIRERLTAMEPHVEQGSQTFAEQLTQHGTTLRLRMKPRQKRRAILLHSMDLSRKTK
jgi:hypothetical protein